MIDWLTVRIGLPQRLPQPINGGQFVRIDEAGHVEIATARRKRVAGSHEASVNIRAPGLHELELEGNCAKFLQGHNLWGSNDSVALLWAALERLEALGVLGCSLASLGLSRAMLPHCTTISRVDCTVMLLANTPGDVGGVLRSLRSAGRLRNRGESGLPFPWGNSQNVSFGARPGQGARHRSITFYDKGEETAKVHPLPDLMAGDEELNDWLKRCLRCEVRLGTNYLRKSGLRSLGAWTDQTALREWNDMMARMDMNGSDEQPAELANLPAHLQVTYAAWVSGADLRSILTRPTYYRQRQAILEATGADISIPRPKVPTAQIVPIKRVIELQPAGRPTFADRIDAALSANAA